jgi:hypothetical protein
MNTELRVFAGFPSHLEVDKKFILMDEKNIELMMEMGMC